jgi:hypothetical protein
MRISGKAKELAELKYIRLAQEISARHYAKIKGHETMMPRGGAMKATIDNEHLTMAQEIAEAYANCHLESFLIEGLLPDANDLGKSRTRSRISLTAIKVTSFGHQAQEPTPRSLFCRKWYSDGSQAGSNNWTSKSRFRGRSNPHPQTI